MMPPLGMGMQIHLAGTHLGEEDAERGQKFITHLQDVQERPGEVIARHEQKAQSDTH